MERVLVATITLISLEAAFAQKEVEPDLTMSKEFGICRAMVTRLPDYLNFENYREADYEKMTLDDPRLQSVYVRLFTSGEGFYPKDLHLEDHILAAYNDLTKRGDAASPILLKLMRDNPYTAFESETLTKIMYIKGIDRTPYLQYAREVVETKWQTMDPALAGSVTLLLANLGNEKDIQMLEEVIVKRPFLRHTIQLQLQVRKHAASKLQLQEEKPGSAAAASNKR